MVVEKQRWIKLVCQALEDGKVKEARKIVQLKYPFQSPHQNQQRTAISNLKKLDVFYRDSFKCRYCGKETIFAGTLMVISRFIPEEFPYHPHWKWNATHPAFWELASSCDHILPKARGGGDEINNLVTSCYQCNSIKSNWTLEELRWKLLEPSTSEWDGLIGMFVKIMDKHKIQNRYLRGWHRLLKSYERVGKRGGQK